MFVGQVDDHLSLDDDAIIDLLFIDSNGFVLLDFPGGALVESLNALDECLRDLQELGLVDSLHDMILTVPIYKSKYRNQGIFD